MRMNDVENGMLDYKEPEYKPLLCPECGEECSWIFKKDGSIIGCENCIEQVSADTALEDEYE